MARRFSRWFYKHDSSRLGAVESFVGRRLAPRMVYDGLRTKYYEAFRGCL
jgi:hypothetical protein